MSFKSVQEAFDALHEEAVEEFLRADAEQEGIPWHVYCTKYGIVGRAQDRKAKRHEAQYDPDQFAEEKGEDE